MLTRSTQIPTLARGKVRALVKAHKHWKVFLHKKGMLSASARNADLIEFALFYPELIAGIEAILGMSPTTAQVRHVECLKQLLAIAECQFTRKPSPYDDFDYVDAQHHY